MNWPPYTDYQSTDTAWLGPIPVQWQTISLQRIYRIVGGSTPKSDTPAFWDGDITWVTPSDLGKSNSLRVSASARRITADGLASCSAELLPAQTVILSVRAPIGTIGIATTAMATNQGCKGLVGDRANPTFVAYQLSALSDVLNAKGRGSTFMELSATDLGALKIAVPPLPEQGEIVEFLDQETAKVDALIAKQQQLIATLREDRTATITHAVTKGLDPAVDIVQPHNSELPACPKHWTLQISLKRLAEVQTGLTLGKSVDPVEAVDVPYLRVANVQTSGVNLDEVKTVAVHRSELSRYLQRDGDVLMTEGGDIDKLGRGCVWSGEISPCIHQNHVFAVRCTDALSSDFLVYLLDTAVARNYFFMTAKKTTNLASTNSTTLGAFTFSLPPRTEQDEIVDHLNERCAGLDALIAKANAVITVLREYRAALITDAVTGKIDVRGAVA